jgi:putative transposase
MAKPEQISIIKHWNKSDLTQFIKQLEKNLLILQRLIFIKHRYDGMSVDESAKLVNVSKNTGYLWQKSWNENGFDGIIPHFSGGRPSKLTEEQKTILKDMLKLGENWTTKEVKEFISKNFGVNYSLKQIRIILHELDINYKKSDIVGDHETDEKEIISSEKETYSTPDFRLFYKL